VYFSPPDKENKLLRLTPIILAIYEADIRRIAVQG
jgi:hypothetical protein